MSMLTEEQRKIAKENHNLIYFFLNHFKVDPEEYYDLFAINYLECIKIWDKTKGTLSTLLSQAFSNIIRRETAKNKTRKRAEESRMLSLNAVISVKGSREITLGDMVASNVDLENTVVLLESIDFFSKNDITRLVMLGYSHAEISKILNLEKKEVQKKLRAIKNKYIKGGGSIG